jgi:hypothetical protein
MRIQTPTHAAARMLASGRADYLMRSYPDAPRVMQRLEMIAETLDVPALMGRR